MDDIYRENILDHYKHPRNFGNMPHATVSAKDEVVSCGDSITMELFVENKIVKDIRFNGTGCAISIAAASMLTESVIGKPISELQQLTRDAILHMLGISLTPTRLKCALLSLEVLHKALRNLKLEI